MEGRQPQIPSLVEVIRRRLSNRVPVSIPLGDWMPAAVLILIYPLAGSEHILLTRRSDSVEHHKGQISFPGGAVHAADADLETTALRETYEEVGIDPAAIEVLGRLDDMVTISSFRVTPVVGILHGGPHQFLLSADEVAEVIEVPLAHLLESTNRVSDWRDRNGEMVNHPAYQFNQHRIWGATARMLQEFLDVVQEARRMPAETTQEPGR